MKPHQFPVNSILFDLDGTLVDTAPDLHRATNHVMQEIGRPAIDIDDVRHMVGQGAKKLMELGLEATGGMNGHDLDTLLPIFLEYYADNLAIDSQLYPDTIGMLETLTGKGIKLAVCTNKPAYLAIPLLEALGIADFFPVITGGDTFPFRKPDPRHLLETQKKLACDGPSLMVGDSINDIAAANNAQWPSVAVSFGYTDIPAAELGASVTIDSLITLPDLICKA
ncbi:phosphoglycolate phosphatase [Kordiimonas sediminis]|uniref:Phosphoglycolate phosphatase n=1 Tax=Kordiimonas sediminis TaxID=1735581 RepID=A0A919EA51_9PROT|nr:HAD family hydrolase [Kordiimonas sediminis]GHF29246.1 phosphoglycolate phosphatase [Kordiimonas sediminis]